MEFIEVSGVCFIAEIKKVENHLTWMYCLENWHGFYFIEKDEKKAFILISPLQYGKNFNPDMITLFYFLVVHIVVYVLGTAFM